MNEVIPEELLTGAHPYAVWRRNGVSRSELNSALWLRMSHGMYAWALGDDLRSGLLRVAGLVPPGGAVGGWAAAHLHGAVDLDGLLPGGRRAPILVCAPRHGTCRRVGNGVRVWRSDPCEEDVVLASGVRVTSAVRTGFDLARAAGWASSSGRPPDGAGSWGEAAREAVVAVDALLRACPVTVAEIIDYTAAHPRRGGVRLARQVLQQVDPRTRSGQESRLRLLWTLDAGLPPPLVNQPVADVSGRIIAEVDLLDPEAGAVAEYDGGHHASAERRAADHVRVEGLEGLGLTVVRLAAPDLDNYRSRTVVRLRTLRETGLRRDRRRDGWRLVTPGPLLPSSGEWYVDTRRAS